MDLDKIEKLLKMIEESSLLEFGYREGEEGGAYVDIHMSRKGEVGTATPPTTIIQEGGTQTEEIAEEYYILSPIVATFYSAPSPDEKPFVTVGEKVKAGETVCILEAMKLLNTIESEHDCEIEAVLVSNGQKVEYGQPLFRIKLADKAGR